MVQKWLFRILWMVLGAAICLSIITVNYHEEIGTYLWRKPPEPGFSNGVKVYNNLAFSGTCMVKNSAFIHATTCDLKIPINTNLVAQYLEILTNIDQGEEAAIHSYKVVWDSCLSYGQILQLQEASKSHYSLDSLVFLSGEGDFSFQRTSN